MSVVILERKNMEKLLVSACLLGENCKYNGGNNCCEKVCELAKKYELVPVCPETAGGLKSPRNPAEICGDKVVMSDGTDVTAAFVKGAELTLKKAFDAGCTKALLKANSPSCGSEFIYDGTFSKTLTGGDGITAKLLKENGIVIFTEKDVEKL